MEQWPEVIPSWLTMRATVSEIEAECSLDDDWIEFKSMVEDRDEIWRFRSPPETWMSLAGRQGFALVRSDKIVACLVTIMN